MVIIMFYSSLFISAIPIDVTLSAQIRPMMSASIFARTLPRFRLMYKGKLQIFIYFDGLFNQGHLYYNTKTTIKKKNVMKMWIFVDVQC